MGTRTLGLLVPWSLILARPAGFEPATYGFEARRSIQLSYGRTAKNCITRGQTAYIAARLMPRRSRRMPRPTFSEAQYNCPARTPPGSL